MRIFQSFLQKLDFTSLLRKSKGTSEKWLFLLLIFSGTYNAIAQSSSSDFLRIAGKITSNSNNIATVWPGFWFVDQPFLFMKHDSIVQVFNVVHPGGDFDNINEKELTPSLIGKAFRKKSYLKDYSEKKNLFPGTLKIGDTELYALEPKGKGDFEKIDFYLHESFHYYQRENWEETAGDTISVTFKNIVWENASEKKIADFLRLLNYERELLDFSIGLSSIKEIKKSLGLIIAIREIRKDLIPSKVNDLIDRYERREGTATFVGLSSSARANQYPVDSVLVKIKNDLRKPIEEFPSFPVKEQQFLRWPHYAIGASLSTLLNKINLRNWQKKLTEGDSFVQIIKKEIRLSEEELGKLKNEVQTVMSSETRDK